LNLFDRVDFASLMDAPLRQGLSIAEDEDGAVRFKNYVLSEKSRIVKKTLPGIVKYRWPLYKKYVQILLYFLRMATKS